MADPLSQVFFPQGFQDLFSFWNRFPDAVLYAGGTGFIREQGRRIPVLKRNIICLDKLEELHRISRTERYLEIGAMVKLNQIIQLGKIVPEALTRCLQWIAGPQIRNIATIGGNICYPYRRLDSSVPMIALDAQYELRTAQSSRWITASRFSSVDNQELLTRIRVPLEPWTYTWYRKFRTAGSNEAGAGILFLMRNQKNTLANIKVIYSGPAILREKNSETMFLGKHLPLDQKDAEAFVECWRAYLSGPEGAEFNLLAEKEGNLHPELMKTQIINFIRTMVQRISD